MLVDPEDDEGGSRRAHEYVAVEGATSSNAIASGCSGVAHTRSSRGDTEEKVGPIIAIEKGAAEIQAAVSEARRVVMFEGAEVRRDPLSDSRLFFLWKTKIICLSVYFFSYFCSSESIPRHVFCSSVYSGVFVCSSVFSAPRAGPRKTLRTPLRTTFFLKPPDPETAKLDC